jgi:uncharacterized protein YbjT (DUF2867 family)
MSKLLVIFGITGQQGASVADTVMKDEELSKLYRIRGVTRDPSRENAQELQAKGVEIVKGDIDDRASIKSALQGANTVFAMTVSIYKTGGREQEYGQGKDIADEAVAAGVEYIIYSVVPSPKRISNGKIPVDSWDVKYEVEQYIRTLPIKSSFFAPGFFMQNFHSAGQAIRPQENGTLAYTSFVKQTTKYPMIDTAEDSGKYVAALLSDPNQWSGKVLCAATRHYSIPEIMEIMSKSLGKTVEYNQIPKETFSSFLPENVRDIFVNMFSYVEEYGYFGPGGEELVNIGAESACGKLTTFEEYLEKNPLEV